MNGVQLAQHFDGLIASTARNNGVMRLNEIKNLRNSTQFRLVFLSWCGHIGIPRYVISDYANVREYWVPTGRATYIPYL